jgi:hypothetical protein
VGGGWGWGDVNERPCPDGYLKMARRKFQKAKPDRIGYASEFLSMAGPLNVIARYTVRQ